MEVLFFYPPQTFIIIFMNNLGRTGSGEEERKVYIYAEVDIDKAYAEITSKSKKIKEFLENNHLTFEFIEEMKNYKNLRICLDNEIQKYIHWKQLSPDLRLIKKNVFCGLEDFIIKRYSLYLEDERLHLQYINKVKEIEDKFAERMSQLMKVAQQQ